MVEPNNPSEGTGDNALSATDNSPINEVQNAATSNNAQRQQPSKLETFFAVVKSLVIRAMILYFITSFFRGQKPATTDLKSNQAIIAYPAANNIFKEGQLLTLFVYLSEDDILKNYSASNLFWYKDGVVYGDWNAGTNKDGSFTIQKEVPVTEHVRNNGSLYLHAFITASGLSPDVSASNFAKERMISTVKQLNKFRKLKATNTKNLLSGETETVQVEDGKIISHWHPNMTLQLLTDQKQFTYGAIPAPIDQYIIFTEDKKFYKPVLYPNDFWNMAKDYKPLNESLSLNLIFEPISLFKWELYTAHKVRNSYSPMMKIMGDSTEENDDDMDTFKQMLLDTNPYLLAVTMIVSIVHSIFELLAFKNDIQFWNKRDSLEGLSVRSVFFSVFQSVVVLLYVMDNETNTLVTISCFVGLCIELWKIKKVVDIKFENGRLVFKDKSSYVESSTRQYDELAFKYLSWVCFPLLAAYSVYALFYQEHKGWYSFVLNILYGYLLTFGFIMMTPQLFINYKLKSVAHLPWRMLTYKFLNTFIDDMFAWVIKMPTMYRIGCFRDDIIFLIYLYQKWIYPVDKTRVNEFGYSAEQEEKQKSIKASSENGNAPKESDENADASKEDKKDK